HPVSSQPNEIVQTLHSLVLWTTSRCQNGHSRKPRIVVAVDELAELLGPPDTNAQAWGALTHLAQHGREAGVHLVASAQQPFSQPLEDLIQKRFPVRLVGRLAMPQDKAETKLLCGPGDFVVTTGGRAIGFQAAYVSARELVEITCQTLQVRRGAHNHNGRASSRSAPRQPAQKRNLLRLYWELFQHWRSKRK
ncbi:MAG: hypothetical protein GY824_25350, partial [Delftia sp.]|nr:hypothetical protein [Delftia sp.]